MKTGKKMKIVLATCVFLCCCGLTFAATGRVHDYQKISDIQGGFTGILNDEDYFGYSVDSIGDLNNDGIDDVAIGAWGDDEGGTDRGAVWILFLNADGTVKSHQKISDTQGNFTGILDDEDRFGIDVAGLGDLNNDGVFDIVASTYGDDDGGSNRGAIWILFLNADGTVKSHQKISDTQGNFTGVLDDVDCFGISVFSLGDLNEDGTVDIGVGSRWDDDGGSNRGAVWILFLNADGTVKSHQKISDTQGNFTGNIDDEDGFGIDGSSLGDLNTDGVTDIIVGAHGDDDGAGNKGAVWILFLNADGTVKSHQKISDTQGSFSGVLDFQNQFGVSVTALDDIDGDEVIDVAVGAWKDDDGGTDRGAVWILFLNSDGTVKSHQKISDTQGNFSGRLYNDDHFGVSVAFLGDLNTAGKPCLIVGAYLDDDGGTDRGAAWILYLDKKGVYHVDGNSGSNSNDGLTRETAFETIQYGIDTAVDGETVLVWPGVYNETATQGINFKGKAITVKSAPDADAAVLEVPGYVAVTCYMGEDENSVLSNFVIRDSSTGIFALFANPTINNVTIVNNLNGLIADNAAPVITNSIFWNNLNGDIFSSSDPIIAQHSFVQDDIDDGLVAYWKLDGDATDSAGNNDGTIYGATTTTGQINDALTFDGVDDHVDLGVGNNLKPPLPIAISAWIKLDRLGVSHKVISLDEQSLKYCGVWFQVNKDSNKLGITFGDGDGWNSSAYRRTKTCTTALSTNIWYHVAGVVRGATDMDLYINGQNDGGTYSGTGDNLKYLTGKSRIGFGNNIGSPSVDSITIDEVLLYNRALSAEEIEAMYLAGLAGGEYGNPMFADPDTGDYHLLSERGRYRPSTDEWILDPVTSPCVDAGNPYIEPTEEPMPNGGRINMGAYGNTATASMSEWPLKADIDRDGIVNLSDFVFFAQSWLEKEEWKQ